MLDVAHTTAEAALTVALQTDAAPPLPGAPVPAPAKRRGRPPKASQTAALRPLAAASTPTPMASPAPLVPHYAAGCGPSSARHSMAAHELAVIDAALAILAHRLAEPQPYTPTPEAAARYLRLQLAAESRELFGCLWLDAQCRAIGFQVVSVGTLTQAGVYPREVVRCAMHAHAAAVVLAHNHPSGCANPSPADVALNNQLRAALALVDVRLLDHLIVTPRESYSMARHGLM